jgi:hypothetical protein
MPHCSCTLSSDRDWQGQSPVLRSRSVDDSISESNIGLGKARAVLGRQLDPRDNKAFIFRKMFCINAIRVVVDRVQAHSRLNRAASETPASRVLPKSRCGSCLHNSRNNTSDFDVGVSVGYYDLSKWKSLKKKSRSN